MPFELTLLSNMDAKHKGMVIPSADSLKGGVFAKTAELYRELNLLLKRSMRLFELWILYSLMPSPNSTSAP